MFSLLNYISNKEVVFVGTTSANKDIVRFVGQRTMLVNKRHLLFANGTAISVSEIAGISYNMGSQIFVLRTKNNSYFFQEVRGELEEELARREFYLVNSSNKNPDIQRLVAEPCRSLLTGKEGYSGLTCSVRENVLFFSNGARLQFPNLPVIEQAGSCLCINTGRSLYDLYELETEEQSFVS